MDAATKKVLARRLRETTRSIKDLTEQGRCLFPFDLEYYGKLWEYRARIEDALAVDRQDLVSEDPKKGGAS